jgi:hypothetical protein
MVVSAHSLRANAIIPLSPFRRFGNGFSFRTAPPFRRPFQDGTVFGRVPATSWRANFRLSLPGREGRRSSQPGLAKGGWLLFQPVSLFLIKSVIYWLTKGGEGCKWVGVSVKGWCRIGGGGKSTPHPVPVASQARHESGARYWGITPRYVVPNRGGEGAGGSLTIYEWLRVECSSLRDSDPKSFVVNDRKRRGPSSVPLGAGLRRINSDALPGVGRNCRAGPLWHAWERLGTPGNTLSFFLRVRISRTSTTTSGKCPEYSLFTLVSI